MKKLLNFLSILTLLLLSFSCASTNATSSVEDGNEKLLKATRKGIVISIPESAKGKATNAYIYRHVKDENGQLVEQMGIYNYRIKDYKIDTITDYFVEKGKEYYYSATYEGQGFEQLLIPPTPVISKGGIGELKIPENIKGTFNEETNNITFTPNLKFEESITNFVNKNEGFYKDMYISYFCPDVDYTRVVSNIQDSKANMLSFNNPDISKLYGHDLVLNLFACDVSDTIKSTRYSVYTNKIDVPKKIQLKDSRKHLKLEQVDNGIKITVPPIPEEYKDLSVYGILKIIKNGKPTPWDDEIQLNFYDDNSYTVIDYFVSPGNEYEYTYTLYNNRTTLLSTYPAKITYNGKTNFMDHFIQPVATYDNNKMTITTLPDVSKELHQLYTDVYIRSTAQYLVENPDTSLHYGSYLLTVPIENNNTCVELSKLNFNEYIYDKPLALDTIRAYIELGNSFSTNFIYAKIIDASLLTSLPSTITVRK